MPLWTVQFTCFNIVAESGEEAFGKAYEQIVDDEANLLLIDMQGWKYNADFSESGVD